MQVDPWGSGLSAMLAPGQLRFRGIETGIGKVMAFVSLAAPHQVLPTGCAGEVNVNLAVETGVGFFQPIEVHHDPQVVEGDG